MHRLRVPAAMVLYNNAAGAFNATVAGPTPITIPVVTILQVDGQALAALAGGSITWGTQTVVNPVATGWPDFELQLLRPGGRSQPEAEYRCTGWTDLLNLSGGVGQLCHAVGHLHGRSARCGRCGACCGKPNRWMGPDGVRRIMQTAADPRPGGALRPLGYLDNVHRQGAGMIDIPGAIQATVSNRAQRARAG